MNNKKIAKYIAGVLIFLGVIILLGYARDIFGISRTISTIGECTVKVPRDKLSITLRVQTLSDKASQSMKLAQNAADELVRGIKSIEDKSLEIQTTRISSYEKTKWDKNTEVRLGVESEIDLEITTDNKDTLNAVLDLPDMKQARIMPRNMRNFSSHAILDAVTATCLKVAIDDARDKAAAIAAAGGEKLGRLISAQFGAAPLVDARPMLRAKIAFAAESSSGDYIQSSDGELLISVSATFGIK